MFDINLLVSAPLACDEGMIHIVNYVPFPKGNYWRLCLGYILCSHATTDIASFQVDFLGTANTGLENGKLPQAVYWHCLNVFLQEKIASAMQGSEE